MKNNYDVSDEVLANIGKLPLNLDGKRELRDALKLDTEISLFDAVIPFLLLVRIPSVLEASNQKSTFLYLKIVLRGMTAHFLRIIEYLKFKIITKPNRYNYIPIKDKGLFIFSQATFFRDVLDPVYKELNKKSAHKFVSLQLSNDKIFEGTVSYKRLINKNILKEKNSFIKKLGYIGSIVFSKEFTNLVNALEAKFGIRKGLLIFELKWLFYKEFPRLAIHLAIANNILLKMNTKILITADDMEATCRIYSLSASFNRINSIAIQQGFAKDNYPDWKYRIVDKIACMGELSRDVIVKQGIDKNDVFITGHPGYDTIFKSEDRKVSALYNKYKLNDDETLVLFTSQPFIINAWKSRKSRLQSYRLLVQFFSSRLDLKLIVKPHPTDSKRELASIFNNYENIILLDAFEDTISWIKTCDILITHFSTTLLQALIAGKPLINIDLANAFDHSSFYKQLGIDSAHEYLLPITKNLHQLKISIDKLVKSNFSYDIEKKSFIENLLLRNVYHPDGRASIRIASLIDSLVEQDNNEPLFK